MYDSPYKQIQTHILPLSLETWFYTLSKPLNERPGFQIEEGSVHIGQVVARFIGMPADEDEYYNALLDYASLPEPGLIALSEDLLNKTIDNLQFQSIQKVLNINREQNLSINRFVAFLEGEQLIVKSTVPALHRKIREAMIDTLRLFSESEVQGLKNNQLMRVLVDLVKWSFNHLQPELQDVNLEEKIPRFLWYGDYKKSHFYFIYFLLKVGCDLIVFSPSGEDILSAFDHNEELTFVHKYTKRKEAAPFPNEKRSRKSTVAYKASKEIETILNHEGSGLYKPWQLRDYTPTFITLKTTYDELFLIMKENAMIRPNFEVENGVVTIPNVFAKVQGVTKSRKEYWDRLHTISNEDNCLLIKQFPFTSSVNNDYRFHYRDALGQDGLLDLEKMMSSNYWRYRHLPVGLQKGIANAIRNICCKPALKTMYKDTMDDVKVYLFTQGMQIPISIIRLLEKFDYSQEVPKLILYNNELNGSFTRSDAALLLLLNAFGIDIVLYNPAGHNDIENFIDEYSYDTHWLEDVVFEQEFKEPSFVKRIIRQGLFKNKRGD